MTGAMSSQQLQLPPSSSEPDHPEQLRRIQQECASMMETLKILHDEEMQLRASNTFLAHRAAVMGCTAGLDGGIRREARRKAAAGKKAAAATNNNNNNSDITPKINNKGGTEQEVVKSLSMIEDPSALAVNINI